MNMSARRQASSSSLSRNARASSPGLQNRSLDFCNAFWGIGDGGVDVLFARMRGATRIMDELRNFWKERASIEEDYAKRLAKLAKVALGKDEIGDLRTSLDTVRLETDRQAGYHLTLAQQIRTDLEAQAAAFQAKQLHHKRTYQATAEKEFKAKQTQESYVNKAREKYESDCVRINSYTAQSSLVQGKDLEKITLKLERAQQTVQANERDFANFAKALQDTTQKWEHGWKNFCDTCQDLEEQRLEFMKDSLWAYANAVSTVCVSDDESCEKMRLALEQMEPERDMESFVREYGTGNQIPDPPAFVNYNTPDAIPSSSSRPTVRPAQFARSSQREIPPRMNSIPPEEELMINAAGVGAGGGVRSAELSDTPLSRQSTRSRRGSSAHTRQAPQTNGTSAPQPNTGTGPAPSGSTAQALNRRPTSVVQPPQQSYRPPQDPHAEPIDPNAETYIRVGNNAYRVDLSNDPQQHRQGGPSDRLGGVSPSNQAGGIDPLAKQLEDLQTAVSTTGSVRRGAVVRQNTVAGSGNSQLPPSRTTDSAGVPSSTLAAPSQANNPGSSGSQLRGGTPSRDYRNSAEFVVGAHPSAASRSPSPNPPTAAFMVPKSSVSPSGSEVVQEVLTDYHQSLPGERKSISRSNSRRASYNGQPTSQSPPNANHSHSMSQGQSLARPPSTVGHPGIGAHGSRSNSPQPPPSRGHSPAPINGRNSFIAPPPGHITTRATSPNTVGIALDPNGRVLHDEMAQKYQQQRQPPVQQQPQQQSQPPQQYNTQSVVQRRPSYMAPVNVPPQAQNPYVVSSAPPTIYQQAPPAQSSYTHAPPPPVQPAYNPPPVLYQPPLSQQPVYQAPPHAGGYGVANGVQRGPSIAGGAYYTNTNPTQQVQVRGPLHPQQQQEPTYRQVAYRDPSPAGRTPSPQPPQQVPQQGGPPPTGQTTEEGVGILFYVKALYDYNATIDEEFDFQAGDIIAVTATPEDGWWFGELLDEDRRQRGRHIFPSNFVCLF